MSIATYLVNVAQALSDILEDINIELVAKGSTAAATLDGVDEKIRAISGGGGITPTGTVNISTNGDHDVTQYATAHVAVPQGITPTGTKNITTNGVHDVTNYASANVEVPTSGVSGTLQVTTNGTKNVAPYEYAQVNVPTGTARTSSDVSVSGPTVTIPAGLYSSQVTKTVSSGSVPNPSISVSAGGLITASYTPTPGYISTSTTKSATQQLSTKSAQTYTPGTSNQTISSGQYLTGTQTIQGDASLVASKIKHGESIFGVTGSYPTGTINITSTGLADVRDYQYAYVDVGGGGGGLGRFGLVNQVRQFTRSGGGAIAFSGFSISSGSVLVGVHIERPNSQAGSGSYIDMLTLINCGGSVFNLCKYSNSNTISFFGIDSGAFTLSIGSNGTSGVVYVDTSLTIDGLAETYDIYPIVLYS